VSEIHVLLAKVKLTLISREKEKNPIYNLSHIPYIPFEILNILPEASPDTMESKSYFI
jgi:hypothetical protein